MPKHPRRAVNPETRRRVVGTAGRWFVLLATKSPVISSRSDRADRTRSIIWSYTGDQNFLRCRSVMCTIRNPSNSGGTGYAYSACRGVADQRGGRGTSVSPLGSKDSPVKRPRRNPHVVYALYLIAALLLCILLAMLSRGNGSVLPAALAVPAQPQPI